MPADFRIPTVDEDPQHAPPWKVTRFRGYREDDRLEVTTDRGDPTEEYDVFEDPPEWAMRLAVAAPDMHRALATVRAWLLRHGQRTEDGYFFMGLPAPEVGEMADVVAAVLAGLEDNRDG